MQLRVGAGVCVCDEYLKVLTAVDLRLMTVSGQHGGDRP